MKLVAGWWMPDHEAHLGPWMSAPKNKMMLHGRQPYQGKKQLAVLAHCTRRRIAVDVGGHCATWAFNLAHEFEHVHAFEPVQEHRNCFVRNTEGMSNITLHACALGVEAGSVSIETEQGSSGNSRVKGTGTIPMHTLDSFELTTVDLIKIDVEGLEEAVLRGAAETLKANMPVVIVEQKRDMSLRFGLPTLGAVRFLESLGYKQAAEISGDHIMVPA